MLQLYWKLTTIEWRCSATAGAYFIPYILNATNFIIITKNYNNFLNNFWFIHTNLATLYQLHDGHRTSSPCSKLQCPSLNIFHFCFFFFWLSNILFVFKMNLRAIAGKKTKVFILFLICAIEGFSVIIEEQEINEDDFNH